MTQIRIIAALVALLVAGGSLVGVYFYGRSDGSTVCTKDALVTYQKGVEGNADVDKQIDRMDESGVDRTLSRWVQ